MTIRHLKTFIAVYEYGGITKAAEALHIAQPAVSQTIAEIEKYYNVILFDRINKKLIITEFGKQLLVKAKETIASFNDFEKLANENSFKAKIKIGSSLTIGKQFIPDILNELKTHYSQINISVTIDSTATIEELLTSGNLDFALVEGNIKSECLKKHIIFHDKLVAISGSSYPIPKNISLIDFVKYPLLLREKGSASRDFFDGIISTNGLNANLQVESSSNQALISCVEKNIGITILPQKLIDEYIKQNILKEIEIDGCNFERNYFLVYHKDKRFSPILEKIISICKSFFD